MRSVSGVMTRRGPLPLCGAGQEGMHGMWVAACTHSQTGGTRRHGQLCLCSLNTLGNCDLIAMPGPRIQSCSQIFMAVRENSIADLHTRISNVAACAWACTWVVCHGTARHGMVRHVGAWHGSCGMAWHDSWHGAARHERHSCCDGLHAGGDLMIRGMQAHAQSTAQVPCPHAHRSQYVLSCACQAKQSRLVAPDSTICCTTSRLCASMVIEFMTCLRRGEAGWALGKQPPCDGMGAAVIHGCAQSCFRGCT